MLILRVDDDGALRRAVKALGDIEKSIPKGIRSDRREAFKAAEKQAKGALGGGHLRGAIRRGTRSANAGDESALISDKVVSPRGIAYDLPAAVNASNRYMVGSSRQSYASGWRHPVHGNRRAWVTQQSPSPAWFTNAVDDLPIDLTSKWVDRLEDAAEYVAANT